MQNTHFYPHYTDLHSQLPLLGTSLMTSLVPLYLLGIYTVRQTGGCLADWSFPEVPR